MTPGIPSFALYGESSREDGAGFAHIETIAVRSALHDWEIKPHRHDNCIQLLLVRDGAVDVSLDGAAFRLTGPCHVTLPVGCVHGFRFQTETQGYVLTLSQDFASRCAPTDPLRQLLIRGGHGAIPPQDAARIDRLAAEALALSHERPGDDRLLHTLAEAVVRCLPADAPGTGEDHRLALFRQLLEVHLREHRSLDFYASRLRITPRSLHRLCQKQLGCSPLALINRRLAIEAQRLLRYTNASVAEVAAELGYADASYFSRGYLRQTGRRPSAERA